MAHANIDERREVVQKAFLQFGNRLGPQTLRALAERFGCSEGAINADLALLRRSSLQELVSGASVHTSAAMRAFVHARDKGVCQYCGKKVRSPVAEHVVPASEGGPAYEYNLVTSCQKCNMKRRSVAMRPANLEEITKDFPEWKEMVSAYLSGFERKTTSTKSALVAFKSDALFLEQIQALANKDGVSVSEWIRAACQEKILNALVNQ